MTVKIRNHIIHIYMNTNIYNRHPELVCTEYIAVRGVKKGQIEIEGPAFPIFHSCRLFDYLEKTAFSGSDL